MSDALDGFFAHFHQRRPVNATFIGVHEYDHLLPDWSSSGLASLDEDMASLYIALSLAHPAPATDGAYAHDAELLDAELARAFLEIQRAENTSMHGIRGNPSLWTGEAVFSVIGLMIRDFAPIGERVRSATARLNSIPAFLADGDAMLRRRPVPTPWMARANRECEGALLLIDRGLPAWLAAGTVDRADADALTAAGARARSAFVAFNASVSDLPAANDSAMACGSELYDVLLRRGHQCTRGRADLLADARAQLAVERNRLAAMAGDVSGSWEAAQEQMAAEHPAPSDFLDAFARTWMACRDFARRNDVVTWPDWPIRYVPFPDWTKDAAPYLYYLFYRSPAPFDRYVVHDYVVPPVPSTADAAERHLRAWNQSAITLNHVVHHGSIGHHVQNWHAYHRAATRTGKVAAVDCASRIAMFCGGTMAEGWACYATRVMDELGFLSPLEQVSEQHARVRFLARAIVDIELHQGTMSYGAALQFYTDVAGMNADAARAEVVKNSIFPCTAVMYWLGTQSILRLRDEQRSAHGDDFSLKAFHDELLRHGSIPVDLTARIMASQQGDA